MYVHTSMAILHDFATVDAGAWVYFIRDKREPFSVRRQDETRGSARYLLNTQGQGDIAAIHLRAVGHVTESALLITNDVQVETRETIHSVEDSMRAVLWRFMGWLDGDVLRLQNAAAAVDSFTKWATSLPSPPLPPQQAIDLLARRSGRPEGKNRQWIIQQHNEGKTFEEAFKSYVVLESVDSNNKLAMRRARDRFRKAWQSLEK